MKTHFCVDIPITTGGRMELGWGMNKRSIAFYSLWTGCRNRESTHAHFFTNQSNV